MFILFLISSALVVFLAGSLYDVKLAAQSAGTNLYGIGAELVDIGSYADAIDVLHRAAYLDPDDSRIFDELGNAYSLAGDQQSASVAFREATRLDPSSTRIHPPALVRSSVSAPVPDSAARQKLLDAAKREWNREWSIFATRSAPRPE